MPPATATPSPRSPGSCSTTRCHGPRCDRSTSWIGLCRRYGDDRVAVARACALDAETDSVTVVVRMLERALEADSTTVDDPPPDHVIRGRFARSDDHFAVAPGVNR